jgi:hypothetical protein
MKLRATVISVSAIWLNILILVLFTYYQSPLMQIYLSEFWLC